MTPRQSTPQDDRDRSEQQDIRQAKQDVVLAVIQNNISYIKADVSTIKAQLGKDYVTREEFDPIKKAFYYLLAIVITSIVGAVMALVLRK